MMITKERARARGALQHLMYCARGDLDDADLSGLYQAEREIENLIEQSQPVPEGWCVDLEPTGHIVMRSPDGDFAVINPPEHEATRLAVVSQFLATMLADAPKPARSIWHPVSEPPEYEPTAGIGHPYVMWWGPDMDAPVCVGVNNIGAYRPCYAGWWCWLSDLPKPGAAYDRGEK